MQHSGSSHSFTQLVALVACLLLLPLSAQAEKKKPSSGGDGKSITLFGGAEDMDGWQGKGGAKIGDWRVAQSVGLDAKDEGKFAIQEGQGIFLNGDKGRTVNLFSKAEHGDIEAHIEFCVPKGSNSGIYFQGRYEIQVLDSWGVKKLKYGDCGGIYQRGPRKDKGADYPGKAPRVNASKAPGQWQSFDIVFRAPRFDKAGKKTADARFIKVVHNGQVIHEDEPVNGPTRAAAFNNEKPAGPLMLQGDHGPVAYRNLKIRKVNLD